MAPVSGIVYAGLAVVGTLLIVSEEVDGSTDDEILSYYGDSGNRATEGIGVTLMFVGAMAFLWFLSGLWSRLKSVEHESRGLADLAFAAGIVGAALFIGAAALLNATATAVEVSDRFAVDPNLARFAVSTGYLFLIGSVFINCALIAATSVLALRTDVFPRWLGWVGFAAIVVAIAESFLLPVFAVPIWVTVVSIVMIRSAPSRDEHPGHDDSPMVTSVSA
jgi:lysylphosphatidylglycerol synthetase-like protein (DUF2156 family)